MNRQFLKRKLRKLISEAMDVDPKEVHRCLDGDEVTLDTPKCMADIEYRIEDAISSRDACKTRTDARVHYNGLLKVLRRKLRQAHKVQPQEHI